MVAKKNFDRAFDPVKVFVSFFSGSIPLSLYNKKFLSPTIFRIKGYRFYFFSLEEKRKHVHVYSPDGEAKFWIEPKVELAKNYKLNNQQINELLQIVKDNKNEIDEAWEKHFGG